MRDRKGYLEISKQRKKGCVKMALDDLWKQRKDKDRNKGEKANESEEYSSGAKYDYSVQFWSSFSRIKTTAAVTSNEDKCGKSVPSLEDGKHKCNDVRDKEDLSNSENAGKIFKCSNKENKNVYADTTSQMVLKQSGHGAKHHVFNSQISMRNMKFEQMMNEKKKYLLNKYKIKKRNHESTNKVLSMSDDASEKISTSYKTNKIQIPVQIDREKLKITAEVRLSEKEVNDSKSFYYKSETMEADSTVSNDKKDDTLISSNKNINELKDVSQRELCQSVTSDKFQDSSDITMIPSQNYLNIKEGKRKRIKKRFRYIFDKCLTMSEEEEEESIIDLCIYKRQKNDLNETSNNSTNIKSYTVLDVTLKRTAVKDTIANLAPYENMTNNIVSTETSEIENIKQVEAVSSFMNIIECNNDKTVSDNDMFPLENEYPVDKNSHIEEITESAMLNNNEEIQTNLSNELQIKIVNYSSENHSLNSKNNAEEKYVKKTSTLTKSIYAERVVSPDSNINNDNCNDANMKVLTNYAINIKTNKKGGSNNNFDEITCHVSQNSYIKESQLIANSDDSGTASKVINSTLDSILSIEKTSETSKNTEIPSGTFKDNVSIDTTTQEENATVANINFTESHAKNINDHSVEIQSKVGSYTENSKCTLKNSNTSQQDIINSVQKVYKQCIQSVGDDLNRLLEMDINQNHRIRSDGNTISIQEDFEKDNQYITAKDDCINNITNKENEISSKHSENKTEESTEKYCTKDTGLKENINTCNVQDEDDAIIPILSDEEAELSTDRVDDISPLVSNTSKQDILLDCNDIDTAKDIDNFKQPETIQPNKIRVLSSEELGSRWCPTPVDNSASSSATQSELSSHITKEFIKDNDPCKDSTTNIELNCNSTSGDIRLTLSYIYNIIMRIRTIEKKYLSNNYQNMTAGIQKTISDDAQFKSNFKVLLQEFTNLGLELKIFDIDKVVQYAMSVINKHYMPSTCEPISGSELSRYMEALNSKSIKSTTTIPSNVSAFSEQGTHLDSVHIASTKPVPNVSNNPNVVPVTLSFIPNLYVPTVSQVHTVYNNSPRQNIYASNVSNQNYEYNISNLQKIQKPSTNISYISSMQPTYKKVQVLQENRTPSINVPYYQRLIQQQSIPIVTMNNVSNVNMQLKDNIHIAPRINMYQKQQEGLIGNKAEFLMGQSSKPQKLPQVMSHNIPQVLQKPQGSQIYMSQNVKNTQVSYSTILPTHSANLSPRANTISHELTFKIWDQITYCFEKKIIDCRLHGSYDKTCPLQLFHDKWKQAINNFIYHRMQSKYDEPIMLTSLEARHMHYLLARDKWRYEQLLAKSKDPLKQSAFMNMLNKKIKRKNAASPLSAKSSNVTAQSEVAQHKSQKHIKTVVLEEQQEPVSNVSRKNNSVPVGSNFIDFDKIMVICHTVDVENVNAAASTNSESKTEKQKNMLKTDGVSSLESDNIEAVEVTHVQKESLLREQTIGEVVPMEKESSLSEPIIIEEVVRVQEKNSLPEPIIIEEVVRVQEKNSLPEQTITEAVSMEKESSLPEQTIREAVSMEKENSLPEQSIREVVPMEKENSLPEQTIREAVSMEKENSLPEQTIGEAVSMEKENSLPEQTIGEAVSMEKENSLPEQAIREAVSMEKENSLPEQTIREELIPEKEHGSLIEQIIRENNNYLQCNSIQSATSLDPHIVDVRSISPTSFHKIDNMLAPNDSELSNNVTDNNEIKVKIEIPEDTEICLRCSKESTVICEVCLKAHYCSRECSELHWVLEHHKYCKPHNLRSSEDCDNDTPTTEDTDFDVNYMKVP